MTLIGLCDEKEAVNGWLLLRALEERSLIIDAANCADPHAVFPMVPEEKRFEQVHVIEVDLLYSFRDVMHRLPTLVKQLKVQQVLITTPTQLFHYQDEEENNHIYEQVWEALYHAAQHVSIFIGVPDGSVHQEIGKRYCDAWVG